MSELTRNQSFERRRKAMKKVEGMVAEVTKTTEALNHDKDHDENNDDEEGVHVSDVSSCYSEGDGAKMAEETYALSPDYNVVLEPIEPYIPDISPVLRLSEDEIDNKFPSTARKPVLRPKGDPLREDETPKVGNKTRIISRTLANDIELEALSTPLYQKESQTVHSAASSSQERTPWRSQYTERYDRPDAPQDYPQNKSMSLSSIKPLERSTASVSRLNRSTASKWSTATPMNRYYRGGPVNSPPFVVSSPAPHSSEGITRRRGNLRQRARPSASSTRMPSTASSRDAFYAMKKEIDDLTTEFENLEKESTEKRDVPSTDNNDPSKVAEEAFEEDLEILSKKSDAMADALHKNLMHSYKLHRDNEILRERMQNLAPNYHNDLQDDDFNIDKFIMEDTPYPPTKQASLLNQEEILVELESSDDYVRRRYPAVQKTPGTMFVTEIVEVMGLDVGEHSYLSEIMNRQWNTSDDYFPKS